MQQPIKTSSLAVASFCVAFAAVLLFGLVKLLASLFPPALGHSSPLTGRAGASILLAALAWLLCVFTAFTMGFIATIRLFQKRGAQKGLGFALSGMLISAALAGYELILSPRVEELRAQVLVVQGRPEGAFSLYRGRRPIAAGTFEHGLKEGRWTLWDARGVKTREITYRSGLREGTFLGWYSSFAAPDESAKGKPLYEGRFSTGRLDGPLTLYYPTGQVRCKFGFDHGEISGAQCWDQQGGGLSQLEAVKAARLEALNVDGYLKVYEGDVEKGVRQLLRK